MKHHRTIHKRYLNAAQKKTKQDENIKDVTVWKGKSSKHLTTEYITNNVVICDGGQYMSTVQGPRYEETIGTYVVWYYGVRYGVEEQIP